MPNIRNCGAFRLAALLSCAVTAACSGGGGGGTSPASAASTPASSTAPTTATTATPTFCSTCVGPPSMGANYDTGIAAGPIAAPAPASFGSAPAQIATSATPTFDKSSGSYPANVTFPLISTSLKSASPGMSAAASPDATLTVNSATPTNFQLVIPSINVNANFTSIENIVANSSGWTWGYSYVAVGSWRTASGSSGPLQSDTFYSSGYETSGSGMPTTGTAQFAGLASGNVYQINNGTILSTEVDGKANLSVNFSSGQVAGSLTQMQQYDGKPVSGTPGYLPWNDVSLNANIAPGTNRFSGTTAATSAPGTSFSMAGSATGHLDGALYGPTAQNLGAVWSLSDGSKSAIGALAAKQ
jgi:hypothetical protein